MVVDFTALFAVSAFLVPITVGVVSVFKEIGLPTRFAGLFSLLAGIGLEFLAINFVNSPSSTATALLGICVGLSAAGLYSGSKALVNNK